MEIISFLILMLAFIALVAAAAGMALFGSEYVCSRRDFVLLIETFVALGGIVWVITCSVPAAVGIAVITFAITAKGALALDGLDRGGVNPVMDKTFHIVVALLLVGLAIRGFMAIA